MPRWNPIERIRQREAKKARYEAALARLKPPAPPELDLNTFVLLKDPLDEWIEWAWQQLRDVGRL